jgi:hypothetical protein
MGREVALWRGKQRPLLDGEAVVPVAPTRRCAVGARAPCGGRLRCRPGRGRSRLTPLILRWTHKGCYAPEGLITGSKWWWLNSGMAECSKTLKR